MQIPTQPPEAKLIEELRQAVRPKLSVRKAADLAGISEGRWRQIAKGYNQLSKDTFVPSIAPAETLARMAQAVGATREQLLEVGRDDAATELSRIEDDQAEAARYTERLKGIRQSVSQESASGTYPEGILDIATELWGIVADLGTSAASNRALSQEMRGVIRQTVDAVSEILPEMVLNSPDAPRSGEFIKRLATTSMKITEGLENDPATPTDPPAQSDAQAKGNEVQEARPRWGDGGPFYVVRMTNGPRKGESRVINQAEFDNSPANVAFDVLSTIPAGTKVSFGDLPIGLITPEMQELIDAAGRNMDEGKGAQEAGLTQGMLDLAARAVDDEDKPS